MAESFRSKLQRAANLVLGPMGLNLVRRDRAFTMDGLLARVSARGIRPGTVIDIGASDGSWSLGARRRFPGASYLLFEPLEERRAALGKLQDTLGFKIVHAAAGAQRGTVAFSVDPMLDGSGVADPADHQARTVPVETIDAVVAEHRLTGPYCLKLDTHGYEVAVLTGATRVLKNTELLIIEAYNFQLTPGCLRFHELCAWLEARGFRCCDLADPMRRPGDGVLWQMDLAFVPVGSPVFTSARYT
ncbi:MAG: FkbM family methyltransferase [Opitutae bacterium]|nr:FkbM family methyltransferase [Opitutae bacterium]